MCLRQLRVDSYGFRKMTTGLRVLPPGKKSTAKIIVCLGVIGFQTQSCPKTVDGVTRPGVGPGFVRAGRARMPL